MHSNQKCVLVMPGTKWQLALVHKIKEMGHQVYIVDPSPEAPCVKLADKYLQSDIFDHQKVDTFIDRNPIHAVISDECDIVVPEISRIGEKYGLSAISLELARLYTDKFKMREFCRKIGLKYPEYRLCEKEADVVEFLEEIQKPIIIKPLDCNASKGVFTIATADDINKYFGQSIQFSRLEKKVLAERYISGTEFTVDGIKTPNGHYTLAISEKKHFEHNINIANELLFTHYNEMFDYELLKHTNDRFVLESELPFGFTHAEYKYENGEFYLIEIAARGGGNMISSVIAQYLSGYSTYDFLINCAFGNILEEKYEIYHKYRERAAVLKFFDTPQGGGRVKKIHGLDYLENEMDIAEYAMNFHEGDVIENCTFDSARIGYYIACSENISKLKQIIKNVENQVVLEMESNV